MNSILRSLSVATSLLVGMAFSGTAAAATYTALDARNSHVTFGYSQMNVSLDGKFGQIQAQSFMFDTDAPEKAQVNLAIPLASVDSGSTEADDELKKADWFDTSKYPLASFKSSAVKPLGDNRYEVMGTLDIKGVTKDVTIPFTYAAQGDNGVFTGEFTFPRSDFGIGTGPWGDFSIVANDVTVKFHVVASR